MEAFEHIVKVFLEAQNYIVTAGIKFPLKRAVAKASRLNEEQTHGYEVDIVAVKNGELILGSVKSYLGSAGVRRKGFDGLDKTSRPSDLAGYRMFNDDFIRLGIIEAASVRYKFPRDQIRLALFAGKFHAKDESVIREHLHGLDGTAGPVWVVGLEEIVRQLLIVAQQKTYINDPVVVTLKALRVAGRLKLDSSK